jgi:CubicO group peptidase (beta-lactamase class C family)
MFPLSRTLLRLLMAALLLASVGIIPALAQEAEGVYEDPAGRFTVPVPTNWTAQENDGYVTLTDPDGKLIVHILVVPGEDVRAAIVQGWKTVAPDFTFTPVQSIEPPSAAGVELTVVDTALSDDQTRVYQGVGQLVSGSVYVALFDVDLVAAQERNAQLQIIITGLTITAQQTTDLSDAQPKTVDASITDELSAYVTTLMEQTDVPGAAVAIVQDGEIVFAQGYGVKTLGGSDPITPDTHMMIGSVGKSMTTMLMATLVDDGLLQWDEPVIDVLPNFAVDDPALTQTITIRNLVCACTGVPRRDLELIFNSSELTAEGIIESLQTFRFFTDFGEAFQYSNQMVATGGYAAAAAAGGEYGQLFEAYARALSERVLEPMGMSRTTLSFDAVVEDGDYATPHGGFIEGVYEPISLDLEAGLLPIAPAGSHWSTANDMARYIITELNKGVSPDGTRVVSEANLAETWTPQIAINADLSYGLGWVIGTYKGQPMILHDGNTLGFTSGVAFLPDSGLGIVVLANGQAANLFTEGVKMRLLELVFDQPKEFDESVAFALKSADEIYQQFQESLQPLDVDEAQPYLGVYTDPALGQITISLTNDTLWLDAGDFTTRLVRHVNDEGEVSYVMAMPPLTGNFLKFTEQDGQLVIQIDLITDLYTFTR